MDERLKKRTLFKDFKDIYQLESIYTGGNIIVT